MLPGQYYDSETGLHYNYFRYYDPQTGRYITSDPIGLQGGLNTYSYALNSPIRLYDPYGLWVKRCSRELGNKNKPATSNIILRHDYLNVNGTFVSFQMGSNAFLSQGRVEIGKDVEKDGGRCHTTVFESDEYDKYILDIARKYNPKYSVNAYPSTPVYIFLGARNCQTWINSTIEKAIDQYKANQSNQSP